MSDDLRQQLLRLLPIDPDDGTIVVGFTREGASRWGSPNGLVDALAALIAEAEARGYQRAIDALRYGQRIADRAWQANTAAANYSLRDAADFLEQQRPEASAQTAIRSGESTE